MTPTSGRPALLFMALACGLGSAVWKGSLGFSLISALLFGASRFSIESPVHLQRHCAAEEDRLTDYAVRLLESSSGSVVAAPPLGIVVRSGSAHRAGDNEALWSVPLQVDLFRPNQGRQNVLLGLVRRLGYQFGIGRFEGARLRRYEERMRLISRSFQFPIGKEHAHRQLEVRVGKSDWRMVPRTDAHGHVNVSMWFSDQDVDAAEWGKREVEVEVRFAGDEEHDVAHAQAQLDKGEALGIISDIDDTIKVTKVFCGPRSVLRNTFLRKFKPVQGMAELYQRYAKDGASFHYVSKSPPEFHELLLEFLRTHGYPSGTMQLCPLISRDRKNFKMHSIEALLSEFPLRRFILIGDSGEFDADIYADVARKHPGRIEQILIRQVHRRHRVSDAKFDGLNSSQWQVFRQPSEVEVPTWFEVQLPQMQRTFEAWLAKASAAWRVNSLNTEPTELSVTTR